MQNVSFDWIFTKTWNTSKIFVNTSMQTVQRIGTGATGLGTYLTIA